MSTNVFPERFILLIWIFLPIIFVWFSVGYLMSVNRQPSWVNQNLSKSEVSTVVLGDASTSQKVPDFDTIKWHHNGLVTLWFDDAWETQFSTAFPKLEQLNFVGALAVPTKMIGYEDYMSWNQIKYLQYKGWEITSHTRNHSCDPKDMTESYLKEELGGALSDLNAHGIRVTNYVSPCGVDNPIEVQIAKDYYLSLRTTKDGINSLPVTDPYDLKVEAVERKTTISDIRGWLNQTKTSQGWLILMFHQIDNNPTNKFGTNYDMYSQIVDLVSQSNMTVVTPTQALQLVVDDGATSSAQPSLSSTKLQTMNASKLPK